PGESPADLGCTPRLPVGGGKVLEVERQSAGAHREGAAPSPAIAGYGFDDLGYQLAHMFRGGLGIVFQLAGRRYEADDFVGKVRRWELGVVRADDLVPRGEEAFLPGALHAR